EIGGVRHRQRGAARQGDRQRDLPRRHQAAEHEQPGEERGPLHRMREDGDEVRASHGDDDRDEELRRARQFTPRQAAGVDAHCGGFQTTGSQLASLQLVPQTTVSPSSSLVPHTTVSPSSVPQTTVSPSSSAPLTPPSSCTVHVVSQSSPPHCDPHTTFRPVSWKEGPHVTGSPSSVVLAPHMTDHALAPLVIWPPWIRRLPQMIFRLHAGLKGYSPWGDARYLATSTAPLALRNPDP